MEVPAITQNQELIDLKIIKVAPATIEFNYEALQTNLTNYMKMYDGLVIQQTDLDFIKKDLAKLNNLKKAIDTFRKDTKKSASENIKTFEDKCKDLISTIDTAYDDIKAQYDAFEEKRKQERLGEVNELIKTAREQSELPPQYQLRIELKPEYLNKTMTDKKIAKDLESEVSKLQSEYTIEQQKQQQIQTLCEVENQKHQLTIKLDPANYYHYDFEQAKTLIEQAGQRAKDQQDEAIRRLEEQARIKAEQEAQKEVEIQAQELAKEQIEQAREQAETAQKETESAMNLVAEMAEQIEKFVPVDSGNEVGKLSCVLKIYGTKSEMEALKTYMANIGIVYERIE